MPDPLPPVQPKYIPSITGDGDTFVEQDENGLWTGGYVTDDEQIFQSPKFATEEEATAWVNVNAPQ